MEFLEEESKPRFLLHKQPPPPPSSAAETTADHRHKPTLFISLALSAALFAVSLRHFDSEPLFSLLLWLALSLLVGPFAPPSATAGDVRVGVGPPIEDPVEDVDLHSKSKVRKSENFGLGLGFGGSDSANVVNQDLSYSNSKKSDEKCVENLENQGAELRKTGKLGLGLGLNSKHANSSNGDVKNLEEGEWSDLDLEVLRKQMVKYPVGMPGRWEAVAKAFSGKYKVESVVKMAKSMGEKRAGGGDDFTKFLKDRKPVDKRIDEIVENEVKKETGSWSAAEDIALLNALKAFPKDVPMRWEKIAAAVPGRSKAACVKRVADLKKDFRSSKGSGVNPEA